MGKLELIRIAAGVSASLGLASASVAASFDHRAFDALLSEHVITGTVDYDAFVRAASFREYLDSLARFDPATLDRAQRLALWINAYNAYTIHLINQHGERDSIRNITAGVGEAKIEGPWSASIARVGGIAYTLDEIEHEVIRKRFDEPRVHFALVCAAVGCPPLRDEAYVGDDLETQLEDQARAFLLRSPRKNRVDVGARIVYVSPIFEWFKEDFGGSDAAIGRFIARYYPDGPERALLMSGSFTLTKTGYDWQLNARGRMTVPPLRVFMGMLRFAERGETVKVKRSLELLGPVLQQHLDTLEPADRQGVLDLLASARRDDLVRGVRLLIARDVSVLLDGVATAPLGKGNTLARTAELEWRILESAVASRDDVTAASISAGLVQIREAVLKDSTSEVVTLVAGVQPELRGLF